MAYDVIMPKAGMAMERGKVIKWLKREGDRVEAGDPLIVIETDKATMEIEAMNTGVLLKILAQEGEEVPVVTTIAYIGEKGEQPAGKPPAGPSASGEAGKLSNGDGTCEPSEAEKSPETFRDDRAGGKIPATPAAKRIAKEKGLALADIAASGSRGQIKASDVLRTDAKRATPLAGRIAREAGLDLNMIMGSGYGGKVTKEDVIAAAKAAQEEQDTIVPYTMMRKVIARRMLKSHLEIPPVTQNSVADVTELSEARKRINSGGAHISFNDFIIAAAAKTLKEQPYINASYTEEGLLVKKHINIGVAVALPGGLIVPVIKDADKLSLEQISTAAKALADKARAGKLMPAEYSGGTFTVSNLGMMGVTSFTPIINLPESAILGVCAIEQRLEMDDNGKIARRFKMGLSLTYDHRSIDGAQAAVFANRLIELLEHPDMLIG